MNKQGRKIKWQSSIFHVWSSKQIVRKLQTRTETNSYGKLYIKHIKILSQTMTFKVSHRILLSYSASPKQQNELISFLAFTTIYWKHTMFQFCFYKAKKYFPSISKGIKIKKRVRWIIYYEKKFRNVTRSYSTIKLHKLEFKIRNLI